MKNLFILMCSCLLLLSPAFADWDEGDPYKMHYPQLPDPEGWDVCLNHQWIADDFRCTETGPITDIHFWISWNDDLIGDLVAENLDVSIWSDGGGMPGIPLWQFAGAAGGNVVIRPYGQGLQGWVCPFNSYVAPGNHYQYFQVNITQINEPLTQIAGTTYWLVIRVNFITSIGEVGWKTTFFQPQFQAPSQWSIDQLTWQPVNAVVPLIWDQAFVITSDEEQLLDFGDAPDQPYATLLVNDGARHIIRAVGPWLGDASDNPDPEPDGQPTLNADGDDNDGNDDEDGVNIPILTIGQISPITFQVSSGDGIGGTVYGWIDYNGNGIWGDLAAELIVAASYTNGVYSVNVTPPTGSVVGTTFARFRITRDLTGITGPTGLVNDGEVEDYLVKITEEQILLDYGDAPDQPYATLLVNDGARHIITAVGPWLGDASDNPDSEADGQPTLNADGDDNDGNDDEDGVQIPVLGIGMPSTITFQVSSGDGNGGMVFGWIDYDGSGIWGDSAAEQIVASTYTDGTYVVTITPPAGSVTGTTYARFRISRDTAAAVPTGLASDGEVEDYLVMIEEVLFDYGDAPDPSYATLLVNDGARHLITLANVGICLGDTSDYPDLEADGQPTANADGDDNDGNDDEDGVVIPVLALGMASTITFQVSSTDGNGGTVYGWIDFNGNNVWGDIATEQIVNATYVDGTYNITISPPAGSIVGTTYARFRISRDIAASNPAGFAQGGEVEDYLVTIDDEVVEEELKFQQLPLNGPDYFGHDELSTVYPVYDTAGGDDPIIIEYRGCYMADDFADLASSPVIRVRWWGSYFGNEIVQPVLSFIVAFESDIPAVGEPGGTGYVPSHPGVVLSKEEVLRDMDGVLTPGEFREIIVGPGGAPCNERLYRYEALLQNPFPQQPNTVYWLKIVAVVELPSDHTLWQDVLASGLDVCDYLVNGYGSVQGFYPVTRWGWHNRDYTKMDPYASTPPFVVPGEHLAGTVLNPSGGTMEVWHFQDDAVFGHVNMPVDPTVLPREILEVIQPDWLEQYYQYALPYCPSPTIQGVDGPEEIVRFSKDLAFVLWTGPETITTPTIVKTTPAPAIGDRVNSGRTETFVANAVSSLGHAVEYQFDWGDGTTSAWGAASQTHIYTYTAATTYNVIVQARCIAHPAVVSAPAVLVVTSEEISYSPTTIYAGWAQFNRPKCWAYPRQCRGDADGKKIGVFWVQTIDLNVLKAGYSKLDPILAVSFYDPGTGPIPAICADFDHAKIGVFRVQTNDLNILKTYYSKIETLVPVCPIGTGGIIYYTAP